MNHTIAYITILAAMAAPWLHDAATRAIATHRQRRFDQHADDALRLASITDLPVFEATLRDMPATDASAVVQQQLLGAVGDEAEVWLRAQSGGV